MDRFTVDHPITESGDAAALPQNLRYLAVDGISGVGKSQLARRIAERCRLKLYLDSGEANPFLDRFFKDPNRWAFQAQISFLTSRYWQQRMMRSVDLFHNGVIADYAFDKDRIFAGATLKGDDLHLYETLFAQMEPSTPQPDLVIFLQGTVEQSKAAYRTLDLPAGAKVDEGYFEALHHAYMEYYFQYTKSPLLIVNTETMDCANRDEDFEELMLHVARPQHHGITYLRSTLRGLFT